MSALSPPGANATGSMDSMAFLFGAPPAKKQKSNDSRKKSSKKDKKSSQISPLDSTPSSIDEANCNLGDEQDQDKIEYSIDSIPWNPLPVKENVTSFSQLGISSWLVRTLAQAQISTPTDIQLRAIPAILQGKNVIGRAKTGSGKTAAFALPLLEHLSRDPYGIFALIITPTRELALQIEEQFNIFGSSIRVNVCCIIGGQAFSIQSQQLDQRPHIVIATPGRLNDMLSRLGSASFKRLRYLVLDEVDRLFEPGFAPALQSILEYLPPVESRQTLFFSATITPQIIAAQRGVSITTVPDHHSLHEKSNGSSTVTNIDDENEEKEATEENEENETINLPSLIRDPIFVSSTQLENDTTVEKLKQLYLCFPSILKEAYLAYLLRFALSPEAFAEMTRNVNQIDQESTHGKYGSQPKKRSAPDHRPAKSHGSRGSSILQQADQAAQHFHKLREYLVENAHPMATQESCIVFTKKCRTAAVLSLFLRQFGIPNVSLHSKLKQSLRMSNLKKFRSSQVRVLIATDVAARGLDIPHVTSVINYDLPFHVEDYVHRIGRTARANREGMTISFVTQNDVDTVQEIEAFTRVQMTEFAVDENKVVENIRTISEMKNLAQLRYDEQQQHEAEVKGKN